MTAVRFAFAILIVAVAVLAITAPIRALPPVSAAAIASPTIEPSALPTGGIDVPLVSTNPALIVPSCQEDEAIVGFGDFHPSGFWDRYECVNVSEIAADVAGTSPDPAAAIAMARLALKSAAEPWAPEFVEPLLAHCQPVVDVGTFIGCQHDDPTTLDTDYAGLIWVDGQPTYDVGP